MNKTFKPSQKFVNQQFLFAAILLGLGVFALASVGKPHGIGMGILFLVLAFSHKNREMIKMMDNNMEVKLAPLASTQYIKYSDIDKVERVNEKKIFVHYKAGDKTKKLRVPVHMMEPKDLTDFLSAIEK